MMKLITEYYKYHGDIPRLFIRSYEKVVTNFTIKKDKSNINKLCCN